MMRRYATVTVIVSPRLQPQKTLLGCLRCGVQRGRQARRADGTHMYALAYTRAVVGSLISACLAAASTPPRRRRAAVELAGWVSARREGSG
jgi:hypothetical protein